MATELSPKRREILDYITEHIRDRGYPPSVREIADAVGLASPATVHTYLLSLERMGYLKRDPTKPRALEVHYDPSSGAALSPKPVRHIPLVESVAPNREVLVPENVEELFPLPEEFTGTGQLFMIKVSNSSMTNAGILDGDYVVARYQEVVADGDLVIAGSPHEEGAVKIYSKKNGKVILSSANNDLNPLELDEDQVVIYGKIVTIIRKL